LLRPFRFIRCLPDALFGGRFKKFGGRFKTLKIVSFFATDALTSVTRLANFRPLGGYFILGSFLLQKSSTFLLFFSTVDVMHYFVTKMDWATF
jgi:hypothetical protein